MRGCDFEHEGFCILQDEYPEMERCPKAKGGLRICIAKESDLIELCPDCEKPTSECECGTCWVLATDKKGNVAILSPKHYEELKEKEESS